ncbi:MAG TPA: NAD(P)H-hydrate dehydratase [Bacteroidia bacterium]|jgi:hydroxyethylthiazole kinase-like uncharacterized protein yjeF|nr:NAD(P)H-hydrate dehydratase [Bacteroidia bacterium]
MKILSAQQIREADTYTIAHEPVSSIDLMERAAKACALRIAEITHPDSIYLIFCGKGNNGSDGLAIARLLAEMKRKAEVFIINHNDNASEDFSTNLKRLEKHGSVKIHNVEGHAELVSASVSGRIEKNIFIIDALLGTGLNKPVEGLLAETIELINSSVLSVVAIDIPSGLFCDEKPTHKRIIRAGKTLSFQRPKFTFLFNDFAQYVGEFEILDIGLNEEFIELQTSDYFFLHSEDIHALLKPRQRFSHKGSYGHALLLAGSTGKTGAAVIAAKACLRSGAGLLTAHLPSSACAIMQTALPEAMVNADENADIISSLPKNQNFSAIAMGPGTGTSKETAQALKLLIQNAPAPMVLDADALNILAENKTWVSFLPPGTILTPHPKEFDRLCGAHTSDFERLQTARQFAQKNNLIIVLKSAFTTIVLPDKKVFFNSTGNPALAKGGSGDALTGIILGLLSQSYSPENAAIIAVFIHGYAADLYIQKNSAQSMLVSDLIELLPKAFLL